MPQTNENSAAVKDGHRAWKLTYFDGPIDRGFRQSGALKDLPRDKPHKLNLEVGKNGSHLRLSKASATAAGGPQVH
jgi:hypothetical protein